MNHSIQKAGRFGWRVARNAICITPWGRNLLFPPPTLANCFGRGDADYASKVFLHHYRQLSATGFRAAAKILEVGPGQNLGTSVLMWALNHSRAKGRVTVILWDVFPNMIVDRSAVQEVARALLNGPMFHDVERALPHDRIEHTLRAIACGELLADIRYRVQSLSELIETHEANDATLVYSQSAIECIWDIAEFWRGIIGLTKAGGWHSHRIDLSDHGRRETNYIEMLEWSPLGYYVTMRFIPGAINRWRASTHTAFITEAGLEIRRSFRETKEALPIPRSRIHRMFRSLNELDLRTTAIDLVAVKQVKEASVRDVWIDAAVGT